MKTVFLNNERQMQCNCGAFMIWNKRHDATRNAIFTKWYCPRCQQIVLETELQSDFFKERRKTNETFTE